MSTRFLFHHTIWLSRNVQWSISQKRGSNQYGVLQTEITAQLLPNIDKIHDNSKASNIIPIPYKDGIGREKLGLMWAESTAYVHLYTAVEKDSDF